MAKILKKIHIVLIVICLACQVGSAYASKNPPTPKMRQFIKMMVQEYHFNLHDLTYLLTNIQPNETILKTMRSPYEKKPWEVYRRVFVNVSRAEHGAIYWQKHQKTIASISKKYKIPPRIIIGIIGVETKYGENKGSYKVLDALTTLAFHYPRRSKFFTKELVQYLLYCRDEKVSPSTIKGSYAGAIGLPQFMPSSIRHYGVRFNKTERLDLIHNDADAMMSVANYLKMHGWHKNQPIATPASVKGKLNSQLISRNPSFKLTVAQFKRHHIIADDIVPANLKASLIYLPKDPTSHYWLVFPNFKVIMKYNPRIPYAMAVYQLSEMIRTLYDNPPELARHLHHARYNKKHA